MTDTDQMHDPLFQRIHHFLELGYFEKGTSAYGIALQVADHGESSLKGFQHGVWNREILPILSNPMNDEERLHAALDQDREDEWRDAALDERPTSAESEGTVRCANCGHPTTLYGKSPDFPLCDACEG